MKMSPLCLFFSILTLLSNVVVGPGRRVDGPQDVAAQCTLTFEDPVNLQAGGAPINLGNHAAPRLVDWDSDGDSDLLVGGGDGYVWLFRNTGSQAAPVFAAGVKVQAGGSDLRAGTTYTGACFADLTGDGLKDLIVAHSDNRIRLYRNVGSAAAPAFNGYETLYGPGGAELQLDSGCGGRIDVADWDADGCLDLVTGGFYGYLRWYGNSGTASQPRFESTAQSFRLNGTVICWPHNTHPRVFDFNGDGVLDLTYGLNWADVGILANSAGPGTLDFDHHVLAMFSNGQNFGPTLRPLIGDDSIPDYADLNNDGTIDITTGGYNGKIFVMYGIPYTTILDRIEAIMSAHTLDLGTVLRTDSALRTELFGLHRSVRSFVWDTFPPPSMRNAIRDWYAGHISRYPQYLLRQYLDPEVDTYVPYLAGQVWVNLFETEPDSTAHRTFVADTIGASGRYRNILIQSGTLFIENSYADDPQQRVVEEYLAALPREIWDCEVITIADYLGDTIPSEVAIQARSGVNIFGLRVGVMSEGFPPDSAQHYIDTYTACLAHEINHRVDNVLGEDIEWLKRKYALIEQACPPDVLFKPREGAQAWWDLGVDWDATKAHFQAAGLWDGVEEHWTAAWNTYWSTGTGSTYNDHWLRNNLQLMCEAPQESFATLANQYFNDGTVMFDLCLRRWNRGIHSCINQFLFFADSYSQGQNQTWLYRIDTQGVITRWSAELQRNAAGYINCIEMPTKTYRFALDADGFVTAIYEEIQHGTVWAGSSWTTVNFTWYFSDAPVVVAGPATSLGWHPGVVRVRNVTSTSFQIKFQEWDYLDGVHSAERIHWLAVDRGTYDLGGGKKLIADKFVTNKTSVLYPKWVSFPEGFSGTPVVLTQVQTFNGSDTVTDRICGVYPGGMHFSMQEQESKTDGHCNETVGYIAVSPGVTDLFGVPCEVKRTAAVVTHNPYTLTGSQGQCNVRVQEEQSKDAETLHWAGEKVGFISLAGQPPLVADMQTCNGKDPCELRCTLLWGAPGAATGVSADDRWQAVPYGGLALMLGMEPWEAAGPCTLLVRAERQSGAELTAVDIAVGQTVAESLPLTRACEPGETVTLSAPVSISHGTDVLVFSHWEVDGEPAEFGQATIQVETTARREAVAFYIPGD